MRLPNGISRTLAVSLVLVLALGLVPSVVTGSNQKTTQQTGDPCASTDLEFSFGVLTECASAPKYRFSQAVDITLSLTASEDLAFKSMTVDIAYHGNTVFSVKQLCLIPEGCLIKAGQTISTTFTWVAAPPAGKYTAVGTLVWDFPCSIAVPPCLLIISPLPAVTQLPITVNGGKA